MRLNYKRLENYVQVVNKRNVNLEVKTLLGVSVKKVFIPSIANTVGTDFKKYKIVEKHQFVYIPDTSRRGDKIGIAMLEDYEKALVSQAYTVFEIIDDALLNPEYLMMWFRRPEFDRYARFKSHGSVREIFGWDEICDIELPIPSIEKQNEIVAEYNTIVNRIKLNETLNQKLEDTAQALYKHWFVDFEFPIDLCHSEQSEESLNNIDYSKGYKSSGGKMVYNEELDLEIPEGWEVNYLNNVCKILNNKRKPISGIERELVQGVYPYYGAMGIVDYINNFIFDGTYLLVSEDGVYVTDKNGYPSLQYVWGKFWVNNHAHILQGNDSISTEYLKLALKNTNVSHLVTGAAQPKINLGNLSSILLQIPDEIILNNFNKVISKLYQNYKLRYEDSELLMELKDLVLSKMSKVETKTVVV